MVDSLGQSASEKIDSKWKPKKVCKVDGYPKPNISIIFPDGTSLGSLIEILVKCFCLMLIGYLSQPMRIESH